MGKTATYEPSAASSEGIDFAGIKERADLRTIIEADLGPPDRARKWCCPFHDDTDPSMGITPDDLHFKCWSCGAIGDVLDWLGRRDGLDVVEAARFLDPSAFNPDAPRRPRIPTVPAEPKPEPSDPWLDPSWQAEAGRMIRRAEVALWSEAGRDALRWLHSRGLADATIRRFRLGYFAPAWTKADTLPISAPRGIAFPWPRPRGEAGWVGCNVRRLNPDPFVPWSDGQKCLALAGSKRGHLYPHAEILPTQGAVPLMLVEGEIDGLIGWQQAGHLVHVGTVGGADQVPKDSVLALIAYRPWLLLAFDRDQAGANAAWNWRERFPHKSRRLLVPHGKDLADFHAAGGDVAAWVRGELARLALRPIARPFRTSAGWAPVVEACSAGWEADPYVIGEDVARPGESKPRVGECASIQAAELFPDLELSE